METYEYKGVEEASAIEASPKSNTIPFLYAAEAELIEAINERKMYDRLKRLFDFLAASVACIVLSPFMLLVAIIIFLDDPHGSPFFVSNRCGMDGKEFPFIKFRSMCVDAEAKLETLKDQNEMDGPVFKIENDPRITRFGKFIRRTSIDELPQLINVICGHMSVVGPRPPIPREVEQYTDYQRYRLAVRPGLTCYWQVQPKRNRLTFDNWVELDMKYILNRGFALDIALIFKTFGAIFRREGQ